MTDQIHFFANGVEVMLNLKRSQNKAVEILSVAALIALSGCNGNDSNSAPSAAPASTSGQSASQVQTQPPAQKSSDEAKPSEKLDVLSDQASDSEITIKRMGIGAYAMDVLDPNPKGTGSSQSGSLVLALCGPRISDSNVDVLKNAAYPIIFSSGSQVLMHRDRSYQFGDGSNASSAPPYVLMTCGDDAHDEKDQPTLSANSGSEKVQVKHLRALETTMEVLDPNPKGHKSQPGNLILVMCAPRITDSNIHQFNDSAYPILLTQGSQLALRRDTSYRFGDGTNASSVRPEVVISCE